MKTSTSQKIKTGVFVLAAFGVLAITIFLIGSQKNMFASTFPAHADFNNVSGLQVGNYVRFEGINVGTVGAITIKNDTSVRVDFVLQSNVKPYIKADSRASIGSDGLMGDKLVQIAPGTDSAGPLKNGELIAVNPMDMDKLMNKLGAIANDAQTITGNLAQIIYKVNNGNGSLGKLLNSNELANNIEATVTTTNQTENTIKKAASGLSDNMEAAKHSILFRGYFKKKEKQRIEDSIKNVNKTDSTIKKNTKNN
jgi:phospholipid/cholesterol/gamma-HCH transport system substrate-binding protein